MGDPICKWRAARPHNVVELVNMLPHHTMPNDEFRDIMEKAMPGFFHTPYQLACQLGLYYVDKNGFYHPRFDHDITEDEAVRFLEKLVTLYYIPNPYTPRGFTNLDSPIFLERSLVEYLENHGSEADLEQALQHIIKEDVGNLSATKTLLSYSKLITFNGYTISLAPNYKQLMEVPFNRSDKDAFFSIFDSQRKNAKIKEPLQLIFYGAPGTGKSYTIDCIADDSNSVRTTFHPDSDYASFVGAYKPTMADMPINAIVGTTVHHADNGKEKAYEKKIVYKYVPQAFLKAYVAAWSNPENPHFLIIEEINRGNCAQIFGDLFQLLDRNNQGASSYAIHADEDIAQFLANDEKGFANLSDEQKENIRSFVLLKDNGKTEAIGELILNGHKLLLPPNLYIWATMNTSDQSLFPIDSAFKRRWNWRYVPIKFFEDSNDLSLSKRAFEIKGNLYSWSSFLQIMNPIISELTESADKQMGFFFAKPDKKSNLNLKDNDVISEEIFVNKVLFYLWSDVLKDYNIGRSEFMNPDKQGKALEFSDFFIADKDYLNQFIKKLGVTSMTDNDTEDEPQETNERDNIEE